LKRKIKWCSLAHEKRGYIEQASRECFLHVVKKLSAGNVDKKSMAGFSRADCDVSNLTFSQTGSLLCSSCGIFFFYEKSAENIENKETIEEIMNYAMK